MVDISQIAHSRRIRFQSIGDDLFGLAVSLQRLLQEPQRRRFIPFLRDIALENFAFMIDCTPKIMDLSIDLHKNFIDVPAPMTKALILEIR